MRHSVFSIALALAMASVSPAAAADCYADYKAKQDAPLRLHYGVIRLSGECTAASARAEVAARLHQAGWTLLNVLSIFGADGLAGRQADAGPYFLRF